MATAQEPNVQQAYIDNLGGVVIVALVIWLMLAEQPKLAATFVGLILAGGVIVNWPRLAPYFESTAKA